jgi:predicted anti-sigma-YlaC factor YlaD
MSMKPTYLLLCLVLATGGSGCSIRRMAINKVSDALASGGTTMASDDDPELIKAAAPFSLKLMETLLAQNPKHDGLLRAASGGFAQYAYAFVQQDAEEMEDTDLAGATRLRTRARKLYLRAHNYGLQGLAARHPGFEQALRKSPREAVKQARKADVPLLYWTAVSWAAAVSLSKDNPELIGELPMVDALIDRAVELDEAFDYGAIHGFLITYEMSRAAKSGDPAARSRQHFERAVALSKGQLAGPYISYAEAVCEQAQDAKQFKTLLNQALAINPDARPEWRLENLVLQRRAQWLLSRMDQLFLNPEPSETKSKE